ncbi:CopG family ribbon-helix-helix protein [Serratia quinivorans]|uniref:CopG family ribbon-helix-helix protein n=1 Tax=Serratia quinivorans TaxID=137545 RepID=UPI003F969F68
MSVMSVRLSEDLSEQLEALAKATGRTKSFLAGQAIRDFINREAWQIAETQQAIIEADRGDFASDDEMAARFKKMGVIDNDEN